MEHLILFDLKGIYPKRSSMDCGKKDLLECHENIIFWQKV
jgi:hypothetical protein